MKKYLLLIFVPVLIAVTFLVTGYIVLGPASAQTGLVHSPAAVQSAFGTAFTYQGQLIDEGAAATGNYDFEFLLFDDPSAGAQVGSTLIVDNHPVTDGLFTVSMDFGGVFDGSALFLEIRVREGSSADPHEILTPRQPLNPTPYALFAGNVAEYWQLGFTIEDSPFYTTTIGRSTHAAGAFQSDRGVADIYFIFPMTARENTIQNAQFLLLDRSGTYAASATMTLETYDLAGTLQHIVSAGSIDLQSTLTETWTTVPLSVSPDELVVSPDEFLAVHFNLSTGSGGDLDVRPIFEVEVR